MDPFESSALESPRERRTPQLRKTVLVVDDDCVTRLMLESAFVEAGVSVETAVDAEEALQLLKIDASIGFIVSDVLMPPGIDGLTLAREARQLYPGLGIILTSGYAAHLAAAYKDFREFRIVSKPLHTDDLIRDVRDFFHYQS